MLLGCPWSAELDGGGNPLLDRSCLVRTAQRALFGQSLLKIPLSTPTTGDEMCPGLVKLCEVMYHRPQEEIKGKIYPEQVCAFRLLRFYLCVPIIFYFWITAYEVYICEC